MPKYLNRFGTPEFIEETILDEAGEMIGTIRIKPSSVLWKPGGKHRFHAVPLKKFADWITADETKAKLTKK